MRNPFKKKSAQEQQPVNIYQAEAHPLTINEVEEAKEGAKIPVEFSKEDDIVLMNYTLFLFKSGALKAKDRAGAYNWIKKFKNK